MSSDGAVEVMVGARSVSKTYRRYGATAVLRSLGDRLLGRTGKMHEPEEPPLWALRDVSFEVKRGDALAIVGRNGAGKTTILKILSRISNPTSGEIAIAGPVASMIELGAGFHPELTGRENIFLNGSILGMRRAQIEDRFDEIVAFADIGPYLDTPVKRYSSGMFVRLGFAVAAHIDAEILLIDEVLAVGDLGFQRKCLSKLSELIRGGSAVIFVSHNLHLVQGLASHALFLDHGRVEARGSVGEVLARYVDTFNAASGDTDVSAGSERQDKETRITGIQVIDGDDGPTESVSSGEPVSLRVCFSSARELHACRLGLSLWTSEGVRIATLDTGIDGLPLSLPASSGNVVCTIPELALMPDRYYVRGGIYDAETGWPIDRWGWEGGEVTSILVLTSTKYSRTVVLTREHGIVHIPAEWVY